MPRRSARKARRVIRDDDDDDDEIFGEGNPFVDDAADEAEDEEADFEEAEEEAEAGFSQSSRRSGRSGRSRRSSTGSSQTENGVPGGSLTSGGRGRGGADDEDIGEDDGKSAATPSPSKTRKRAAAKSINRRPRSSQGSNSSSSRASKRRSSGGRGRKRKSAAAGDEEEDEEQYGYAMSQDTAFTFSQQAAENSQGVMAERPSDRRNLDEMDPAAREKAVMSLSRLVLFKALNREPIDRLKVVKEAGISESRIASAAFQEVNKRLGDVFGFSLNRFPSYMEHNIKGFPAKFSNRLYVLNDAIEAADGMHCRAIHSVHPWASIEKGLLMVVLAFCFCRGEPRSDGTRWILARDLYRLLHSLDDNIPEEPPEAGTARAKNAFQRSRSSNGTPNVDSLIEQFVQMDYLIREKATDENFNSEQHTLEDGDLIYTMGPRAALEVGRKQVIFFCAEILDEEPDPTMLKEVEDEEDFVDDEGEDAYMQGVRLSQSH